MVGIREGGSPNHGHYVMSTLIARLIPVRLTAKVKAILIVLLLRRRYGMLALLACTHRGQLLKGEFGSSTSGSDAFEIQGP